MSLNASDVKECTICSTPLNDEEELVVRGYFGILPVAFCFDCYSSIMDMAEQDSPMIEELEEASGA
jgi:hypothetical protein